MEKLFFLFLSILILLSMSLFSGCSSTPKATQYPERYIDQPYTLPSKVDVWGTVGSMYYEKYKNYWDAFLYPIPLPIYWEHSFNDNLTLEIPLIPMGLRWKILANDSFEVGLHVGWDFIYYDWSGLSLLPNATFMYKKIVDKNHAFILSPTFKYVYFANEKKHPYANETLSFGYLTQINDRHAIEPKISIGLNGYIHRTYFPLELFYSYRMTQVWQFESTYQYVQTDYEDYSKHSLFFMFKKFY